MKLKKVRVTKFKSVKDSGEFKIDPNVTCLVGKNESGKTALLQAMEKVNPVIVVHGQFDELDYPRSELTDFRDDEDREDVHAVITTWDLSDDDVAAVEKVVGPDVLIGRTLELRKGYYKHTYWLFERDEKKGLDNLLATSDLYAEEKEPLEKLPNIAAAFTLLGEKKETSPDNPEEQRSPREHAVFVKIQDNYGEKNPSCRSAVIEVLKERIPKMVYFSDYLRMPGQVSLDDLTTRAKAKEESGNRVFLALLDLIGKTAEDLVETGTFERLQANLEAASNKLTKEIFKYWTQNRQLKVQFRFEQAMPKDPPPFNKGWVMRTRIENTRHGVTTSFDDRSTGFVWFFSFLVWFSQVKKHYGNNLVILLDEPGLSLHAKAQADLLRYFEERLANYQVIYTTHSPFMIDPANLMRARTVEDVFIESEDKNQPDQDLGTKVGDDALSTDKDTLFPLQAALGYDITQTLFIGEHTLLVEGPSELLYLPWFSRKLISLKRTGLDTRWTLTPCGGIDKIPSFLSLFVGQKLHIATLVDFAEGGKKRVNDLRSSELLKGGHVFSADFYLGQSEADIEDIIGREIYVQLVNSGFGLAKTEQLPKAKAADAPIRVVKEAENHFRTLPTTVPQFDHFRPAEYLNQQAVMFQTDGMEAALDRFERLFRDLNTLLP